MQYKVTFWKRGQICYRMNSIIQLTLWVSLCPWLWFILRSLRSSSLPLNCIVASRASDPNWNMIMFAFFISNIVGFSLDTIDNVFSRRIDQFTKLIIVHQLDLLLSFILTWDIGIELPLHRLCGIWSESSFIQTYDHCIIM